jgi:hypothetical protein
MTRNLERGPQYSAVPERMQPTGADENSEYRAFGVSLRSFVHVYLLVDCVLDSSTPNGIVVPGVASSRASTCQLHGGPPLAMCQASSQCKQTRYTRFNSDLLCAAGLKAGRGGDRAAPVCCTNTDVAGGLCSKAKIVDKSANSRLKQCQLVLDAALNNLKCEAAATYSHTGSSSQSDWAVCGSAWVRLQRPGTQKSCRRIFHQLLPASTSQL